MWHIGEVIICIGICTVEVLMAFDLKKYIYSSVLGDDYNIIMVKSARKSSCGLWGIYFDRLVLCLD